MSKARVLVVDDDRQIQRALGVALRAAGYDVSAAHDGIEAVSAAATTKADVVLLDIGLPRLDGVEVLRRLRSFASMPIVVVSARHDHDEKVQALDLGADDYITKPFDIGELLARLRAVLRRVEPAQAGPTRVGIAGGEIDLVTREVTIDGTILHLTRREFDLLTTLVNHPRQVLTHGFLLEQVWGPGYRDDVHYLHVYINRLRRRIERDPENPQHLIAERGVGYRFLPLGGG